MSALEIVLLVLVVLLYVAGGVLAFVVSASTNPERNVKWRAVYVWPFLVAKNMLRPSNWREEAKP